LSACPAVLHELRAQGWASHCCCEYRSRLLQHCKARGGEVHHKHSLPGRLQAPAAMLCVLLAWLLHQRKPHTSPALDRCPYYHCCAHRPGARDDHASRRPPHRHHSGLVPGVRIPGLPGLCHHLPQLQVPPVPPVLSLCISMHLYVSSVCTWVSCLTRRPLSPRALWPLLQLQCPHLPPCTVRVTRLPHPSFHT
jgi:hypothetical protein